MQQYFNVAAASHISDGAQHNTTCDGTIPCMVHVYIPIANHYGNICILIAQHSIVMSLLIGQKETVICNTRIKMQKTIYDQSTVARGFFSTVLENAWIVIPIQSQPF